MINEMTKDEFFDRLEKSFDVGMVDTNLKLIAKESIWSHLHEEPIVEMNTKSIDYVFSQDDGIVIFMFPSFGLEVELKVSAHTQQFLSIETRDGDIVDCGQYGEKLVGVQ